VAVFIDDYNTDRRHSTNGMLSPVDYEHARAKEQASTTPAAEHSDGKAA
jgi:transposase InsO family protein